MSSEFCAQKNIFGMTAFLKVVMSLKNSRADDQSKSVDEILSYGDVAFKEAIAIIRIAYVVLRNTHYAIPILSGDETI